MTEEAWVGMAWHGTAWVDFFLSGWMGRNEWAMAVGGSQTAPKGPSH
jgi:hypothetical protein